MGFVLLFARLGLSVVFLVADLAWLADLLVPLSGRERTILRGLAAGRSPAEMAADLVLSANTIKTQVSSLYRKLNAHSREEALAEATRLHLL